MKILFVINDLWSKYCDYEHTGTLNNVHRRAVEIELTEDQVKKLHINEKLEEIESVSVVLEPMNENL